MDFIERISPQLSLFFVLYGGAIVVAIILCLYLLMRQGNAIAAHITPPMRLRRWAAAFFAVAALSHIWWFLFYLYSWEDNSLSYVVVCLLDCVALMTTFFGTMLSMLQDRKRTLSPFVTAMIPIVILGVLQIVLPGVDFMLPGLVYSMMLYVIFTIYMVIAIRHYGRWLRDNYSDLENKEVLQSHTLLIVLLMLIVADEFVLESIFMFYFVRVIDFVVFGLLLWRVETLPQLEVVSKPEEDDLPVHNETQEPVIMSQKSQTITSNIGQLLTTHCVNTQLYLQHDLTLQQLAIALGTNRSYLSQYFSGKGINYNAYINGLRINHFISLYHEAVASQRPFTIQQLASDSGYRSYSTFSLAFKQRTGQSVTAWMRRDSNK